MQAALLCHHGITVQYHKETDQQLTASACMTTQQTSASPFRVQACLVQEAAGVAEHGHLGEQLHVGAASREEVCGRQLLPHAVQLDDQLPPLCKSHEVCQLMISNRPMVFDQPWSQ